MSDAELVRELVRELRAVRVGMADRAADRIESQARELLREAANSMDAWDRIHGWTRPRWTAQLRAFLASPSSATPEEWISVNDRYPDVDQKVLYYFDEVGIHVGKYHGLEDGIHYFRGRLGFLGDDVTHWMPLPASPSRRQAGERQVSVTDERLAELIANIQAFIDTDCVTVEDADVMSALRELQSARQRIACLKKYARHIKPCDSALDHCECGLTAALELDPTA